MEKVTVRFDFSDLSRNGSEDAQCILEDETEVFEGIFIETDARDQFDVGSITEEEAGFILFTIQQRYPKASAYNGPRDIYAIAWEAQ